MIRLSVTVEIPSEILPENQEFLRVFQVEPRFRNGVVARYIPFGEVLKVFSLRNTRTCTRVSDCCQISLRHDVHSVFE